jgi:biopolymer transport protein TolR
MSRKPSLRSKSGSKPVDLNLIPYLDIVINIIMFMLLTSTGLLQIGMINVNAPRIADSMETGGGQPETPPPEKQINLTVGITYQGLFIAGVGGVIGDSSSTEGGAPKGPTIPLVTSDQACQDALVRKVPPPASCYDFAQPDVPYEVLVKVMDSSRQDGERSLFFDVILSPEIG